MSIPTPINIVDEGNYRIVSIGDKTYKYPLNPVDPLEPDDCQVNPFPNQKVLWNLTNDSPYIPNSFALLLCYFNEDGRHLAHCEDGPAVIFKNFPIALYCIDDVTIITCHTGDTPILKPDNSIYLQPRTLTLTLKQPPTGNDLAFKLFAHASSYMNDKCGSDWTIIGSLT